LNKESSNGHQPKRAILYARVSTEEQARSGYSLAQQLEALREYAAREGYEVLEEVVDPGHSGASLARPGMDLVRDLVAAGGVSVVLAQDRDRFVREPAYHYLLRREFAEHGCKLRALNDRGDDSPEGELANGILDQIAKFERAKMAERTRRGRMRKAREGKNLRSPQPPIGFRYEEKGDGLVIHEPEMLIVKKVFEMAAAGHGLRAIQDRLYSAGMATRKGNPVWDHRMLRRMVSNDIYKPHTYDEFAKLVTPEVARRLDQNEEYGVRWHNRYKITEHTVSEADGNGGRRYRRRTTTALRPKDEWVALPVPAYLPRSVVEQARAAMASNRGADRKHLAREWELRGLMRCSCGSTMRTHTTKPHARPYHYYSCARRRQLQKMCECEQPSIQARKVEPLIWELVSGLLKDPEHIRRGLERMIALQREGTKEDPEREAREWTEKLAEADSKRSRYQDIAAEGLITFDELRAKLANLQKTREAAERELEALRNQKEHLEELEKDRDVLLGSWTEMVPAGLDNLSGLERNKVYRMLNLLVTPAPEGYEVSGAFCSMEPCGSS
jgi:site-specific DNA recombinase